jgi:hypothetical protein
MPIDEEDKQLEQKGPYNGRAQDWLRCWHEHEEAGKLAELGRSVSEKTNMQ